MLEHSDAIVEVKCLFPNMFAVNVHYELPIHYMTEILARMKCENVLKCIYISYSKESSTFFKCTFDDELWAYYGCTYRTCMMLQIPRTCTSQL